MYLFSRDVFNDIFINPSYEAWGVDWVEELIVIIFGTLSWHLSGGTENIYENPQAARLVYGSISEPRIPRTRSTTANIFAITFSLYVSISEPRISRTRSTTANIFAITFTFYGSISEPRISRTGSTFANIFSITFSLYGSISEPRISRTRSTIANIFSITFSLAWVIYSSLLLVSYDLQ
jgi:hypothetical protein